MYEFVGSERYYRDYQYAVTIINNNTYGKTGSTLNIELVTRSDNNHVKHSNEGTHRNLEL
jgi:hypothetical protein